MTVSSAIEVVALSHSYEKWDHRVRALSEINLTVKIGEWITVVGPNGSGKSTLLALLAGRIGVQTGMVRICGRQSSAMGQAELARSVFLVHQDPTAGTAARLTVAEHVMLADSRKTWGRQSTRRVEQLLESFQLQVPPGQPVDSLSGGQRQLLALLIASLRPAPIVLLDEPLAALDSDKARLCDDALHVLQQTGKTLVLVTHDLAYATSRGSRTVVLVGGRVAADLSSSDRRPDRMLEVWEPHQKVTAMTVSLTPQ